MCGILGTAFIEDAEIKTRLSLALDMIAHRGPDGQGAWHDDDVSLLHRRLAIIDLTEGGHQPMVSAETGNCLTYNGEIYNYVELREGLASKGFRFQTQSDSEVLLKSVDADGPKAIGSLNGMWAFAHWDRRNKRLLLCRDRFGVKPLYYAYIAGGVAFASEPKALIALDPELAEVSEEALDKFILASISFDGGNSFFKRIKCLPAGHYAIISPNQREVRPVKYWGYPEVNDSPTVSKNDLQHEFEELFNSAVALRLRSDVPVGITLSGGLDSTAILSRAAPVAAAKLNSFCATFGDDPGELHWAKMAADKAHIPVQQVLVDGTDWMKTSARIAWHMDAPSSYMPTYALWKIAEESKRANTDVLLEGQGADELFGGYVPHGARMVWDKLGSGQLLGGAALAFSLRDAFGLKHIMRWIVRTPFNQAYLDWQYKYGRGRLIAHRVNPAHWKSLTAPRKDVFDLLRHDHSCAILPGLLQYGDAITMAHGVESRLPFMDYRVVEWVFRNRPLLAESGYTKLPVRRLLSGSAFTSLAERRDKKGFTMPTARWIDKFRDSIDEEIMNNSNSKLWSFVSRDAARKLYGNHLDDWSASHMIKLISLHFFLHNYS